MTHFKSALLVATVLGGAAIHSSAIAQTAAIPLQVYVTDPFILGVAQSPGAPLSLADNSFAIQAPGNPQTVVATTGTAPTASGTDLYGNPTYTPGTGYVVFDGDLAVHGTGSSALANVIVRALNCFGTPSPLGNGAAVAGGNGPTGGSLKFPPANSYNGTPSLACNNGTWVTKLATAAAPTNGLLYGTASNDQSKVVYFVPGTQTYEVQPQFSDYSVTTGNLAPYGFAGKFAATGSGFGQKAWAYGTDVFDDGYGFTTSQPGAVQNVPNPFVSVVHQNPWSHVQFASSDATLPGASSSSTPNLGTYNANAATRGGPAIQFPLFVDPIAIAYNSVYGAVYPINGVTGLPDNTQPATKLLKFNAKGSATYPSGKVASLQLTGSIYCGIFNGMITNWNDPALTQANKNIPLYDPVNDSANRWNAEGAPIRLVGRMDTSGNTDIFTRHLAQVCSQSQIYGSSTTSGSNYYTAAGVTSPLLPVVDKKNFVPNKYLQHNQTLPYNKGPNFTSIRSDTSLTGAAYSASKFAGSVNTVSGDFYNAGVISNIGVLQTGTAVIPSTPTKWNGSGLFIVANGASDLAAAINLAPDYSPAQTGGSESVRGLLFNGKIGYISTDNVIGTDAVGTPSTGSLVAAVLATLPNSFSAVGGIYTYTYFGPTLKNALSAFNNTSGTLAFLPPESDATGAFVPATTATTTQSGGQIVRSNPVAWTDQLYQNGASYGSGLLSGTYTLAQPSQGYPIVGTNQLLTYTCFSSAGNRQAIATLVATLTSTLTVDSTNTKINKGAFTSPSAATPGILSSSSLGILPTAWQVAIARTFLQATSDVNTSTTGGGLVGTATTSVGYAASPLNFTSAAVPTKVKVSAGVFTYTPTLPNTACAEGGNGTGSLIGL